ncbi:MAG: ATP synthase subunit I [Gallionella sp.]|nr:ATP synthase subunit I [Gallionella sp.]MDD4959311.1 ATP synthase subunit I [Gallionella sp.]
MNPVLLLVFAVGLLLGGIFFGGLWWTVRRAMTSPSPARWFLISLIVRSSLVVLGFYAIAGQDWQRWVACVLGLTLARFIITRKFKLPSPVHGRGAGERENP